MDASTAENRFEGPRDRRTRLRRASDRQMLALLTRKKNRCAEIGCEERVWLGSEFCIWHPKLKVAGQSES